MRFVLRNALISGTIATVVSVGFFFLHAHKGVSQFGINPARQLTIDVGLWWFEAVLGAIVYGALAARWGVSRLASSASLPGAKNVLLGVVILILIQLIALIPNAILGLSGVAFPVGVICMAIAIAISDARASRELGWRRQTQSYRLPEPGFRRRLAGFGVTLIGAGFIAMAIWVFLSPAITAMRTGHIVIETANKVAVTWSHDYAYGDHPVVYIIGVLREMLAAIVFLGLGLMVCFSGLIVTFGPAETKKFGPRGQRVALVWFLGLVVAPGVIGLLLLGFPYLLRNGVLS